MSNAPVSPPKPRPFKYVPAVATDIRKTFKRVREELKRQQQGAA